jgi:hypothetical protein
LRNESNPLSFKEMEREGWHEKAPYYHDRAGQVTTQAIGRLLDAVAVQRGMRLQRGRHQDRQGRHEGLGRDRRGGVVFGR